MAKTLFTAGGCPPKTYKALKRQAPNCTCTYDDYDERLIAHDDCPTHGEKCTGCTREGVRMLMSECPIHKNERYSPGVANIGFAPSRIPAGGMAQCQVTRTVGDRVDRCGLAPDHDGIPCAFPQPPASVKAYDPPPTHYDGKGIDPWAVWDAFDLDRYTANAVKYLLRAGKKDIAPRVDDLRKARNYINKAIEMEEKREADQGS